MLFGLCLFISVRRVRVPGSVPELPPADPLRGRGLVRSQQQTVTTPFNERMFLLQGVTPATQTVCDVLVFLLLKEQLSAGSGAAEQRTYREEVYFSSITCLKS